MQSDWHVAATAKASVRAEESGQVVVARGLLLAAHQHFVWPEGHSCSSCLLTAATRVLGFLGSSWQLAPSTLGSEHRYSGPG